MAVEDGWIGCLERLAGEDCWRGWLERIAREAGRLLEDGSFWLDCRPDSGTRRILQAAIDITSLPSLNWLTGWLAGWLFAYLAGWLVGDSGWRGWL